MVECGVEYRSMEVVGLNMVGLKGIKLLVALGVLNSGGGEGAVVWLKVQGEIGVKRGGYIVDGVQLDDIRGC